LNVEKRSINTGIVPIEERRRRQCMCLSYKRHSKKSRGEAQSTSYNKEHWNIVKKVYLKKYA